MTKSMESKRSKSRSSSSSHRSSTNANCLSTAFTFDGIGGGDFQLNSIGADQQEINDILESLQSHEGAALMSDFSDTGCLPFDSLDSFNFGFSSGTGLGSETVRQPRDACDVLGSQNNDTSFESASDTFNGKWFVVFLFSDRCSTLSQKKYIKR